MNKNPLIHIGYGRSASTTIQRYFRQRDSRFNFGGSKKSAQKIIDIVLDEICCSPQKYNFGKCRDLIAEIHGESICKPLIFSERLTGHWYSGGYDSFQIADRIHREWPDAKILICIREQKAILSSIYRHYIAKGGTLSFESYARPDRSRGLRLPQFNLDFFKYNILVEHYISLFGARQVKVVLFEQLIRDRMKFFKEIYDYAEVRFPEETYRIDQHENIGMQNGFIIKRFLNRIFSDMYIHEATGTNHNFSKIMNKMASAASLLTRISLGKSEIMNLNEEVTKTVFNEYVDANKKLVEIAEIDLSDFGYQLHDH